MKQHVMIPFLAMILTLGMAAAVQAAVPSDASEFNGHWYKVFNTPCTWDEAKSACASEGGHLAVITSAAEQTFIETLQGLSSGINYWLGGTDAEKEGTWKWITGEAWSYTNWYTDQPDNKQAGTGIAENYLQLCCGWWNCKWNDTASTQDNTASSGYICEWDSNYTGEGITPGTVTKAKVNSTIKKSTKEEITGSSYPILQAKAVKVKKRRFTLKWNKVTGASKYLIYGNRCNSKGKKYKYQYRLSTKKTTYTPTRLTKNTFYKFLVVAISSDNKVLSVSKTVHVGLKNKPNPTRVKVNKKKVELTLSSSYSNTFQLKCSIKGTTLKQHRKIAYETDNVNVATVTGKGLIKAVGAGSCTIYAYAQNGVCAKIAVTVY